MSAHAPLPAEVDLAVIGGGIVGICAAAEAAAAGARVLLLEKGRLAGEQSSRNWGWIRVQGRDFAEIEMALRAQALWRRWAEELGAESLGHVERGVLYLASDAAEDAAYDRWFDHARERGLSTRRLSVAECVERLSGCAPSAPILSGLFTPTDGRAEPRLAPIALAQAARARGAIVAEGCAVRLLDLEGGRVGGVVTERGRVRARATLLAGGAWSWVLLARHGVDLPQQAVRASAQRVIGARAICHAGVDHRRASFRSQPGGAHIVARSGSSLFDLTPRGLRLAPRFWPAYRDARRKPGLRLGRAFLEDALRPRLWSGEDRSPFERMRVLDPEPDHRTLDRALADLGALFEPFRGASWTARWAGAIDVTADELPVIDRLEALPGLTLATGFSGHGFGVAPAAGEAAAALALGRETEIDLAAFTFARFGEA